MAKGKRKRPKSDPNVAAFEAVARLTSRDEQQEQEPEKRAKRDILKRQRDKTEEPTDV